MAVTFRSSRLRVQSHLSSPLGTPRLALAGRSRRNVFRDSDNLLRPYASRRNEATSLMSRSASPASTASTTSWRDASAWSIRVPV